MTDMTEMKRLVNQRLAQPKRCAFLVGAGISVPPPSLLPSAVWFIEEIIKEIDADNVYGKVIKEHLYNENSHVENDLKFLRFETVMASIAMLLDPGYNILQIFSKCMKPNRYHNFLAQQLSSGAIVMTTNFDNLIEIECRKLSIPYDLIVDEEDIVSFALHPERYKYPLIKLHGGYDAIRPDGSVLKGPSNLKATLEQVGSILPGFNRTGLFKLLASVFRDRHVCVLGYSGCDDFDIMPMLGQVEIKHGLNWLNYSKERQEIITSTEAGHETEGGKEKNSPPYKLLRNIRDSDSSAEMMIVTGKPEKIFDLEIPEIGPSDYKWNEVFNDWKQAHLGNQSSQKLFLSSILTAIFQRNESIKILETIDSGQLNDLQKNFLNFSLACDYYSIHDFDKSIGYHSKVIMNDSVANRIYKGHSYYTLARFNVDRSNLEIASIYLSSATKIFEQGKDMARLSDCLHEKGRLNDGLGNHEAALKDFKISAEICESIGDLGGAGMSYGELANVYRKMGNSQLCEESLDKAIKYHGITSNKEGMAIALHLKGILHFYGKNYDTAEKYYKKALELEYEINAKLHTGHTLHCLGDLMVSKGKPVEAREYLKKSIAIKKEIGDEQGIRNSELLLQSIDLMGL